MPAKASALPVTFAHLTDLHLQAADEEAVLGADAPSARLRAVLAQIETLDPRPAFIAITGDLADNGDEASYRLLADCLRQTRLPALFALGNHDDRAAFRAVFDTGAGEPNAPYCHDRLIGGLHVIALDTLVPGQTHGRLSDAALDFFDDAVLRHPQSPKVVMMHHPPRHVENGPLGWDSLDLRSTAALSDRFRRNWIDLVICGHVHRDHTGLWTGALLAGNAGLANCIDPTDTRTLVIKEGASWGLCTWWRAGPAMTFMPLAPHRAEIARVEAQRLTGT